MSSSGRLSDALGVLRGLQRVAESARKTECKKANVYWHNSSWNHLTRNVGSKIEQTVSTAVVQQAKIQERVENLDKYIPKELKLPPVTEADLEELAKDIDALGYTTSRHISSPEGTTVEDDPILPSKQESVLPEPLAENPEYNSLHRTPSPPQPIPTAGHKVQPYDLQPQLSSQSKESKVPANRISRIMSFGGLAAGLGAGAIAEVARRGLGIGSKSAGAEGNTSLLGSSPLFSDANMERIVSTLCRVRGAALKLGQMLSIQDNSMLNPQLQAAFERVRQSADFMPLSQMEKAMSAQLGADWRNKFAEFDNKPFAAASIGQVHRAVLHDGEVVAVKVQYPGVARSINSDINNLLSILKVWQVLPKGMYAENLMDVSRHELSWECDYKREARCMKVFGELLKDDPVFVVPKVYEELSTDQVLVTQLIPGVPLDKCTDLSQETRDNLGLNLLKLCLTELYDWNVMQTDPNWSNFFYEAESNKIYLLDFGATRQYSRKFVDIYINIIKAASTGNRESIVENSIKLGFLTGYDTKAMIDAHVEAVTVLGGPCGVDEMFDFGRQDITKKIENVVPVMLKHRLSPPPEETYSLHRKLSGAFLLCAKLKSRVNVKSLYDPVFARYEYGLPDREYHLDEKS